MLFYVHVVGKGTIIERFMKEHGGQDQFAFSVSHTTRSPRPGEVHGQHYHFVSVPEMKALLANNSFLESAQVHGNYYGTSWMTLRTIQQQGKRCLLDIDVQGVQNIKQLQQQDMASMFRPKYVFIAPPSMETLEERLLGRGTESAETLQRRVANAVKEVEYGTKTGNFDAVIVNNNLDVAVQEFVQVVRDLYS